MKNENTEPEGSELRIKNDDIHIPYNLEDKTVRLLHERKLLKDPNTTLYLKWASGMAAAILMFALGALWNQYYNNSDSWSHIMLLYEDENFNEANSKNAFSEYAKWASEVRHRGFKITGEKLGEQKTPVGFSPHHTDNQRLTGYFLIESSSLDQVMQIAKKSPHVKYGGQIEIRTIDSE